MPVPLITGFSIRISSRADQPHPESLRPLLSVGYPVAVQGPGNPLRWSGWALASGSSVAATYSADGVTVLLAGELYHRCALREAIGPAASGVTADTQLLLACWLRYGASGLRLLNGRFAAVITDGTAAVLATDHAGSVPLYLRRGLEGIEVATEAKAFAGSAERRILAVHPPRTGSVDGLPGVCRVRAGTALTVMVGRPIVNAVATWRPPDHRVVWTEAEAVRRVTAALHDAVHERLDDGPVSVVLSGGLDSSSVAALGCGAGAVVETISLGTDAGDEFAAARTVAEHLATTHREFRVRSADLLRQLPWAVAAAEITDAEVLEYLLPLVVLYRALPATGRRILTGYGADIPLGGMHRTTAQLAALDQTITTDMQGFDGLNEMSPVLGGLSGHWTTHPFWDRTVLNVLVALEPGLKRRHGQDKWVLREAMRGMLPETTVTRPKLGIHEGSGATSVWTALLRDSGVAKQDVVTVKNAMTTAIHGLVVAQAEPPDAVSFDEVLREVTARPAQAVGL
jgi:(carboxyethyl)arginine beta-lactam-synthase